MTPFYNHAPSERNDYCTTTDSPGPYWQPLGAVLRREARRLDLCRERAVLIFEAAGINIDREA